jgi:hypothetical protein
VGLGLVSAKTEPTATVKKLAPADKIKSRLFIRYRYRINQVKVNFRGWGLVNTRGIGESFLKVPCRQWLKYFRDGIVLLECGGNPR